MERADVERSEALARAQAEELTRIMREPLGNVDGKCGRIERDSPLFFGTGENPTLF